MRIRIGLKDIGTTLSSEFEARTIPTLTNQAITFDPIDKTDTADHSPRDWRIDFMPDTQSTHSNRMLAIFNGDKFTPPMVEKICQMMREHENTRKKYSNYWHGLASSPVAYLSRNMYTVSIRAQLGEIQHFINVVSSAISTYGPVECTSRATTVMGKREPLKGRKLIGRMEELGLSIMNSHADKKSPSPEDDGYEPWKPNFGR